MSQQASCRMRLVVFRGIFMVLFSTSLAHQQHINERGARVEKERTSSSTAFHRTTTVAPVTKSSTVANNVFKNAELGEQHGTASSSAAELTRNDANSRVQNSLVQAFESPIKDSELSNRRAILGIELKKVAVKDCTNMQFAADVPIGAQLVYPMLYRKHLPRPLNTLRTDGKGHRRGIRIGFIFEGKTHSLRLQRNRKLLHSKKASGRNSYDQAADCYYQGYRSAWNMTFQQDQVFVSTCHGLRGVIEIDGEAHAISPYGEFENHQRDTLCRPHLIYKLIPTKDGSCANQSGQWTSFEKLHKTTYLDRLRTPPPLRHRIRRNTEPKYIELALIVDSTLYLEKFGGSEDRMTEFILQVTNVIDMIYQNLNMRVGLVHFKFWTEDKSAVTANPRLTLQNFVAYAESELTDFTYDLVHLISGQIFDGNTSGLAIPDSVCTKRGVAVISSPSKDDPRHLASVTSHMIGHSIGLHHNSDDCECDADACIMDIDFGENSPTRFSTCSRSRMEMLTNVGLGSCLFNEPLENPYPQRCGNGLVERGEQCDCGSVEECMKTDPCCNAETCLLKFWALCRSGPCCEGCLPKTSREVCRPAQGECDADEMCDGVTGECPADVTIADGQPCSAGYCHQGRCPSHNAQCQQFWNSGAKSANLQCYEKNHNDGTIVGHCGFDKFGRPVKCNSGDVLCGLLQCQGGTTMPVNSQLKYTSTVAGGKGAVQLECKTITTPSDGDVYSVGLVADGTKCDEDRICVNHKCISPGWNFTGCPLGTNNITCSGHGRCTVIQTCACHYGYSGQLCEEALPTSSSKDVSITGSVPFGDDRETLDTKWLILIICIVAVVVGVALVLVCLCFRRRIVSPKRKKVKRPSHLNESVCSDKERTISFGNTPSYRSEKDGKRKRRRKRRPSSSSGEDESDNDGKRRSRSEVAIPEELFKQPERGILKKSTSSAFEGIEDEDCCNSQCSCSDSGSCSCSDNENASAPADSVAPGNQDAGQEIPPPVEFETSILPKRFETNVQIEVNPCHEVSPTDSEDMKYCATEADQFYKHFPSRYDKPVTQQLPPQGGGDSATDSAIDMPADGSVSTINEIPPHHSTAIHSSSYYKHTPTVADYCDMVPDISLKDKRSNVLKPPRYGKHSPSGLFSQDSSVLDSPTLYEYHKPPTNRSIGERKENMRMNTFQSTNSGRDSSLGTHQHENSRNSDESVTV